MVVLGLDAATGSCGAAVLDGARVLAAACRRPEAGVPARAAVCLLPLVAQVLAAAGCSPAEIDAVAVTVGPGAYSGLRAAVATAQGLALALDRPVVAVGTLEALAHAAGPCAEPVAACLDARRGRLYGAVYRLAEGTGGDGARELHELRAPAVVEARAWLGTLPRPVLVTGPGVAVLQAIPAAGGDGRAAPSAPRDPVLGAVAGVRLRLLEVDPAAVAALGQLRLRAGRGVEAAGLRPVYVSRPQIGPAGPRAAGVRGAGST